MRRRPNLKLLVVLLLALIALGTGTHFLHAYQVKRNAGSLRERAEQAKGDEDFPKALDYLGRYLGFRPEDTEALTEYALLYEQQAKTPRARFQAFFLLDQALRRDPDREALRRRAVAVALELGRFPDAREYLETLLKDHPNDAELAEQTAVCEEAASHFPKAVEWYEKAISKDPKRVGSYVRLALVYRRRLDRGKDADAVMERLVQANPESFQARLARGAYLRELGLLDAALKEISIARDKLAPDDADVLLSAADIAQAAGKRDDARKHLEHGIKLHPKDLRFYLALASLELRAGPDRKKEAIKRLRQALDILPDRADALWTTADLLLDAGEQDEARKLITRLSGSGANPAAVEYLRARLLIGEDRFAEACAILEKQRPELARSPELSRQADLYLGQCYQRLDNPEQQLVAYQRAAGAANAPPLARLGLASSLLANGQVDEAIAEYRRLMPTVPSMRLVVARLLLLRNLRLPPERRSWDQVEALLRDAPDDLRKTVEYQMLGIEMLLVHDKMDEARKALETATQKEPKEVRYWLGLATLADRDLKPDDKKLPEKSLKILDEAEKHLGDTVALRLARGERLVRLPEKEALAALKKLEEGGKFDRADLTRLQLGLADYYDRLGATDDARRMLGRIAERQPTDLTVRLLLFDHALLTGDKAGVQKYLAEVRKLEGEPGPLWRYGEAARLILLARQKEPSDLAQARKRLAEAGKLRPRWARIPLREAEIDEIEGNFDAALDHYRQAIALGDRSPRVVRRTVQLLTSRRRTGEAKEVLQKIQEQNAVSGDLGKLAAEVSLLNRDPRDKTLDLAGKAVARDSKDHRDHLWRGQVLWATDQRKEAEAAFRKAVELEPKAPETWVTLIGFLADTDRKKDAEAEIAKAQAAIPAKEAGPALAVCYEMVGQRDKAEPHYAALLKQKPDDPATLRAVAGFYLRGGDSKKAEPHLRKLMDTRGREAEPAARWARRTLALGMATAGDYRQSRDALALIDDNLRARPDSPEDQRARALVLALRPGGRRESIRTLEDSFARLPASPIEQLLLAQLYEADRNWPKANEHLLALLTSKGGDNPAYLAHYVRALLRHDSVAEAVIWLGRLERKEPDSARTVEVKARVLARQDKGADAARLVRDFARKEYAAKKEAIVLGSAGALLEELKQYDDAEKLYREFVQATEEKKPENVLVLAAFLAGRDRLGDALGLCERAWKKAPPETVGRVSVAVLRSGRPTAADFRRVEAWLTAALAKKPDSTSLLVSLADLRDAEGRTAEAEKAYRAILAKDPNNALALNNLAWLLALQDGKGAEALELIDRAIAAVGPAGGLLDTRGVIRLAMGKTDEAIRDLEDALTENQTALRWFHLAQAYLAARNQPAAERAWGKAKELQLTEKALHRLEKADYKKVAAALERKG